MRKKGGQEGGKRYWYWYMVLVWDRGAGCPFLFKIGLHREKNVFPFPLAPAQFIGESQTIRRSAAIKSLSLIYWCCKPCSTNIFVLQT